MLRISKYERPIDPAEIDVSVLILTLNEETNIAACLDHLRWTDDVVVFDSFSSDRTQEIAEAFGARCIRRRFTNWSEHQNWAMENIPFRHAWVYYTDADERVPADLAEEILARTSRGSTGAEVAYEVRRRDHYGDTWIRRSTNYPLYIIRLFKPAMIRWSRKVNPVPTVTGPVGRLDHDYFHFPLSKGVGDWIGRHNSYSNFEAQEMLRSVDEADLHLRDLISSDRTTRRHALKKLSFRMPCRPFLRFFFLYVLKGGFLDGAMGLRYCILKSIYQYLIDLKYQELRLKDRSAS